MEMATSAQRNSSLICNYGGKEPDYSSSQHKGHDTSDEIESVTVELSVLSLDDDSIPRQPKVNFNPLKCLFCAKNSSSFQQSLDHMLQKHGLFLPEAGLLVDHETLVEYLHLVIYGYFECIFCGSQRNNAQAAQQHMTGKGHCKIDLDSEESEFRDFYDYGSTSEASGPEDSDDENDTSRRQTTRGKVSVIGPGDFMRLSSGKVLAHRSQSTPSLLNKSTRTRRGNDPTSDVTVPLCSSEAASLPTSSSTSEVGRSKKVAKRETAFLNQLASLRTEDRRSLMHLPISKQRALVMKSRKQVEQARRDENKMLLKIQLKANP